MLGPAWIGIDPGVSERDAAYFAGLIDGEGYLGIVKREPKANRCVTPKFTVRLSVAMTDREPLDALVKVFRVKKAFLKMRSRNPKYKDCFVVDVENDEAARVAATVRPHLLLKCRQADLACEMRSLQTRKRRARMEPHSTLIYAAGVNAGMAYTVLRLSAAYLERCEMLYREVRQLNARGQQ